MGVLVAAWNEIRKNAATARTERTRAMARDFANDLPRNLRSLSDRLRKGYQFQAAYGATPSKGPGKSGKRPIVVAPLEDRIVQRAILDVLQAAEELNTMLNVLQTPTSIGGIKGRGVDDAIKILHDRWEAGDRYVAGSDISGFFQKIPRASVFEFIRRATSDTDFVELFERALTVELKNQNELSIEDRKLFPSSTDGVAQGCPLSALAGNIVLADFDKLMNEEGRGITCIRYIDDFILIGKSKRSVQRALASAKRHLQGLNMDIYDPEIDPKKAFIGEIDAGHTFLGYEIIPGRYPPSLASRANLVKRVDDTIKASKATIGKAKRQTHLGYDDLPFSQAIVAVDRIMHGWRSSYRASKCPDVFDEIEARIDQRIANFEKYFDRQMQGCPSKVRRTALGVKGLARPDRERRSGQ